MKKSFTVNSISEAWAKVNEVFPTDYDKDEASSNNAGYPVYRSTVKNDNEYYQNYYCYICDLGSCLEVTITDHEWNCTTIYINISRKAETIAAEETEADNDNITITFTHEEIKIIRSALCKESMKNTCRLLNEKRTNTTNDIMINFYEDRRITYHKIINTIDRKLDLPESFIIENN